MTAVLETEAPPEPVDLPVLIRATARRVHPRYAGYLTVDDLEQHLWVYSQSRDVTREAERGEAARVAMSLRGAAVQCCEAEKAEQSGYRLQDVAWYSAEIVDRLLPMALDPYFDGTEPGGTDDGGRGGAANDRANLLVQVLDVRGAARKVGWDTDRIVTALGGVFPSAPGYRRRAVSNAVAVAATRRQDGGE